jgi:hypothetical protein|tara:strand:- start:126 stop:437 length:312 start_codon:yes stop_codon:yes gene_type:complete
MTTVVTLAELQAYIGTDETGDFISSCLTSGTALVANYVGSKTTVPDEVHRQGTLICSSEFFHRRSAPQGIAQFATMDGSPVRIAKDPMGAVYPLLYPYVGYAI